LWKLFIIFKKKKKKKKKKKPYKLDMMSKCRNIAKSHLLGFIVLSNQVRQRRSTFFFFFYEKSWNSIPRTRIQTGRHEGICSVMINSHIGSTKQSHNLLGCNKAHRSAFAIAEERKWYERISQGVWYLPRRDWSESEL
jgi:hypothetical protein